MKPRILFLDPWHGPLWRMGRRRLQAGPQELVRRVRKGAQGQLRPVHPGHGRRRRCLRRPLLSFGASNTTASSDHFRAAWKTQSDDWSQLGVGQGFTGEIQKFFAKNSDDAFLWTHLGRRRPRHGADRPGPRPGPACGGRDRQGPGRGAQDAQVSISGA
ncbi:hypothetical protein ACRAWD_06655 [Caulobacter segnis]